MVRSKCSSVTKLNPNNFHDENEESSSFNTDITYKLSTHKPKSISYIFHKMHGHRFNCCRWWRIDEFPVLLYMDESDQHKMDEAHDSLANWTMFYNLRPLFHYKSIHGEITNSPNLLFYPEHKVINWLSLKKKTVVLISETNLKSYYQHLFDRKCFFLKSPTWFLSLK